MKKAANILLVLILVIIILNSQPGIHGAYSYENCGRKTSVISDSDLTGGDFEMTVDEISAKKHSDKNYKKELSYWVFFISQSEINNSINNVKLTKSVDHNDGLAQLKHKRAVTPINSPGNCPGCIPMLS